MRRARRCRSARTPTPVPGSVGADAGRRGRPDRRRCSSAGPARRDGGRQRHRRRARCSCVRHAPAGADLEARAYAVRRARGVPAGAVQADVLARALPAAAGGVPRSRCASRPRGGCRSRSAGSPSGRRTEILARWAAPALGDFEIVRDAAHFPRHARPGDPARRRAAAARLRGRGRDRWPPEDRCFKVELGRRLAAQFRDARFVEIDDSYSFVPIDRPDALAAADLSRTSRRVPAVLDLVGRGLGRLGPELAATRCRARSIPR